MGYCSTQLQETLQDRQSARGCLKFERNVIITIQLYQFEPDFFFHSAVFYVRSILLQRLRYCAGLVFASYDTCGGFEQNERSENGRVKQRLVHQRNNVFTCIDCRFAISTFLS